MENINGDEVESKEMKQLYLIITTLLRKGKTSPMFLDH